MQVYTLRGVEVQFPYDAYACQVGTAPSIVLLDPRQYSVALCFAAGLHGESHSGSARGMPTCIDACALPDIWYSVLTLCRKPMHSWRVQQEQAKHCAYCVQRWHGGRRS